MRQQLNIFYRKKIMILLSNKNNEIQFHGKVVGNSRNACIVLRAADQVWFCVIGASGKISPQNR